MKMDTDTAQSAIPARRPPEIPSLPPPSGEGDQVVEQQLNAEQKRTIVFVIIGIIVVLGSIVGSIVFLMNQPTGEVARIRDIVIIFMAIQSLLTGLALVVLLIQLARLINLLQNEVKPILDSTNETVSNLRGTTVFLSDNLVEPVIKLNEYLAGITQLLQVIGLTKKVPRKSHPKGE